MFIQIAIQYILQLLLPVFFITELCRKQYSGLLEWGMQAAVFELVILFSVLSARWDLTSYYLRAVLPLAFTIATYIAYRRISDGPESSSTHPALKKWC